MNKRSQAGFTLLEVLVAITIFASLSMGAYQVLQGVLRSQNVAEARSERLKELQRAMLIIERDFQQLVGRKRRGSDDDKPQLLQAGRYLLESDADGIAFNRLGWRNPNSQLPRSSMQFVAYRVQDETLERLYHFYPDPAQGIEPKEQALLSQVDDFKLRYFSDDKWQTEWKEKPGLPRGIEVTLTLQDYGDITRLFLLPDAPFTAEKKKKEQAGVERNGN